MTEVARSTSPFPALLLSPDPSPLSSRASSPAPNVNAPARLLQLKKKRQLFDINSTSPEWTASDATLLRARLDVANKQSQAVQLRPGQPARLLSSEERDRLRKEMEEDQRSEGSSAVEFGSWITDDGAEGAPKRGIGAVIAAAATRQDGERRKGGSRAPLQHFQQKNGFVSVARRAEPPPTPTRILPGMTSPSLGGPTPSNSFDGAPPFASPTRKVSPSSPRQSIRIEGFAVEGELTPLAEPSSSPLIPRPPPPTPSTPSVIASLLGASRPATPSPSHLDLDISPSFGSATSARSAGELYQVERPRQRRTSSEATVLAQVRPTLTTQKPSTSSRAGAGKFTSPPRRSSTSTKPYASPASSYTSNGATSSFARLPSARRATTPSVSPPPARPDQQFALRFARRPTMTRQGSMGESFGRLYEGEKAAKRERAKRMMEMKERGGLAGLGRERTRSRESASSSRGCSRSPKSVGEPEGYDYGDGSASELSEVDSEVEVVCDAFGELWPSLML